MDRLLNSTNQAARDIQLNILKKSESVESVLKNGFEHIYIKCYNVCVDRFQKLLSIEI